MGEGWTEFSRTDIKSHCLKDRYITILSIMRNLLPYRAVKSLIAEANPFPKAQGRPAQDESRIIS